METRNNLKEIGLKLNKRFAIFFAITVSFISVADARFLSNINVSNNFNSSSITSAAKSFVGNYQNKIGNLSGVSSLIFNNSGLSSFWKKHGQWSSGTMDLCYNYSPKSPNIDLSPDICGLFSNVSANANPCDALPNRIGNYVKKPTTGFGQSVPLKDWCEQIMGTNNIAKQKLNSVSNQVTLSGKSAPSLVLDASHSNNFDSEKFKKDQTNSDNVISSFENRNFKNKDLGNAVNRLNNNGKAYIYKSYIDQMSKKANNLTSITDMTKPGNLVLPYKNIKEYHADVSYYANMNYKIQRELNFQKHLNLAESKFNLLNNTYVYSKTNPSISDFQADTKAKYAFINNYIENKDKNHLGYRQLCYRWAEQKAKDEIEFELPMKLKKMYYNFELMSKYSPSGGAGETPTSKKLEQIYLIKRQAYFEAKIKLKWKLIADKKADKLKNLMIKYAIASEPFNWVQANNQIKAILNN